MKKCNISEQVLKTIKDEKITPRPKWHFKTMRSACVSCTLFSVLLGALMVSAIFYLISSADFDLFMQSEGNVMTFLSGSMSSFWLSLFLITLAVAIIHFKFFTRQGYKYRVILIVAVGGISTVMVGQLFHVVGVGEAADKFCDKHISGYPETKEAQKDMWVQPHEGRLAGTVTKSPMVETAEFSLEDFNKMHWRVIQNQSTIGQAYIQQGYIIKMVGQQIGQQEFQVVEIRPWLVAPSTLSRSSFPVRQVAFFSWN